MGLADLSVGDNNGLVVFLSSTPSYCPVLAGTPDSHAWGSWGWGHCPGRTTVRLVCSALVDSGPPLSFSSLAPPVSPPPPLWSSPVTGLLGR